ncbi:DNA replication factor C, large subunit [Fistulina hepatica ATCC 64428]|nr:DNA replication factor C, large subunit [Fistulina hepatica ATCC 64428]
MDSDDEVEIAEESPPSKRLAGSSKNTPNKPTPVPVKAAHTNRQDKLRSPRKDSKKTQESKKSLPADEDGQDESASVSKTQSAKPSKPNWAAVRAARKAGPVAPGSKQVPDGAPNALAGLAFVFTGELSSFSRDEAVDLAKRYGGRVTGAPSTKTDYVVLGENAGPKKLSTIERYKLKTLNEDQFLALIGSRKGLGSGQADEKIRKKMQQEEEAIKQAAKEMEKREPKGKAAEKFTGSTVIDPSSQLWTSRYAPTSLKEVCGNKAAIEKLHQWLVDWPKSLKCGFKKPGPTGMNTFRAVLITGTPGIGKTTSAHLCAKLAGFTPVELNASDTRSKKLVENGMNVNNRSLDAFISGGSAPSDDLTVTDRTCLIMDEVDGMSAGDRGGVGALNALIKKTQIPIICIANDRNAQKLNPLKNTCFNLPFHKPQATQIRSRLMTIAYKEQLKIPANVMDQLITGAQSDIRQVLNMMSTWKLSSDAMGFDEGKQLVKTNEKHAILSPFDLTQKILGPYMFSGTARETLGDKIELYFQDHTFMPLFIQENYLGTQPARLRNLDGPEKILKQLSLMDRAASSISDGDLVDGLIHGSEQQWSLMPLHAVLSTVKPASLLYGQGGGWNATRFPQWFGQNSKQNKLTRQLGDIQVRMRLKVSGDKIEIRQSYVPALFPHIIRPLMDQGAAVVDEVIENMDEYFLSREDWDALVELGVDDRKDEVVLKKISGATKSSFTRKYNSRDHPIPFHKAQDLGKKAKKIPSGAVPDIEDAFEVSYHMPTCCILITLSTLPA